MTEILGPGGARFGRSGLGPVDGPVGPGGPGDQWDQGTRGTVGQVEQWDQGTSGTSGTRGPAPERGSGFLSGRWGLTSLEASLVLRGEGEVSVASRRFTCLSHVAPSWEQLEGERDGTRCTPFLLRVLKKAVQRRGPVIFLMNTDGTVWTHET